MAGLVIDIYVEWIFRVVARLIQEIRTAAWSISPAKVTGAFARRVGYGCDKAEVNYTYRIDGKTYMGRNVKPFIFLNSANSYAEQFPKSKEISVRVNPRDPSSSRLLDSDNEVQQLNL
jgi:hypothetical protein